MWSQGSKKQLLHVPLGTGTPYIVFTNSNETENKASIMKESIYIYIINLVTMRIEGHKWYIVYEKLVNLK